MRWMRRETALLAFFAVALIAIVGLVGVGFYYSNVLKEGALVVEHTTPEPDLEVVAIGEGQVTLRITSQAEADGPWTKEGIWGLEWAGGYDQVGAILEINEREVVREFFPTTGELKIGDKVRLDSFAFADNPQKAFGLPYEEVIFSSKLGAFPAWFLNGSRSTWAIFVHGRGATREESLRTLPTVVDLGFPSLIITYRNDAEAPASPSGFHDYGETEWEDLESAAHYALEQGAEELILVG